MNCSNLDYWEKEAREKYLNTKEKQLAYLGFIVNNYLENVDEVEGDYGYLYCFELSLRERQLYGCFNLIDKETLYDIWDKTKCEIRFIIDDWWDNYNELDDIQLRKLKADVLQNIKELEEIKSDSSDVPF